MDGSFLGRQDLHGTVSLRRHTTMKFTAHLSCGPASPFSETDACFVFLVQLLSKLASEMPNGDPPRSNGVKKTRLQFWEWYKKGGLYSPANA